MNKDRLKRVRWKRRKTGLRKRVIGTHEQPRLTVYRSLAHMYAQVIDDMSGKTLAAASTVQLKSEHAGNKQGAEQVGQAIAERAKAAGVEKVAFDRNGYRYHGRIKALADAARKAGLQF